ncbi:hypothetical protein ACIBXA_30920 [Micromonospora echinaurantiaca]|uniref:hypothetical protein n=1 Tax=Micromonospora echinaurantiaca TaxID=47857 RepID=UPI00379EAFF2
MIETASTTGLSVLKRMYAAEAEYLAAGGPGTADFTPLAPFFSREVVLYQAETLPYGGTWRGHEGIELSAGQPKELPQPRQHDLRPDESFPDHVAGPRHVESERNHRAEDHGWIDPLPSTASATGDS